MANIVRYRSATFPIFSGKYSWRNGGNGSWFIRALCAVFDEYGLTMELMQLMTRVKYLMAQFLSDCSDPDLLEKKQIPDIITRLTKELFFARRKEIG